MIKHVWSLYYFSKKTYKFAHVILVLMAWATSNHSSVMLGRFPVFQGWTSTKQQIKYLAQGHNTVTPPKVSLKLATLWSKV